MKLGECLKQAFDAKLKTTGIFGTNVKFDA